MLQLASTGSKLKEENLWEHDRSQASGQASGQVTRQTSTLRTWCHFVQNSPPVPHWLQNISKAAGLFKTHTALSFVLLTATNNLEPKAKPEAKPAPISGRIISNPFAVPGQPGLCRYACTQKGLALLPNVGNIPSGALLPLVAESMAVDNKSGALIMHPVKDKKEYKPKFDQAPPFRAEPKNYKQMRENTKLNKKTSE